MTLGESQRKFTKMVGYLIGWAYANGYELTVGEGYRTPEQAKLYEDQGKGVANSLHCDRLAIDFNVFKDGQWLQSGEQFIDLCEYWESIGGSSGVRFKDGNHFSLSVGGRK